jgi:hypothetical protein
MQRSLDAMKTALRVLTALNDNQEPSAADVSELETFIGPRPFGVHLDDWVRDAIMQGVEESRAASRPLGEFVRHRAYNRSVGITATLQAEFGHGFTTWNGTSIW